MLNLFFFQNKNQNDFESNLNYNFDFLIPKKINLILSKIELDTVSLDSISDSSSGIKEYETGKGIPPQKESDRLNKIFNSNKKINEDYWKHITGSEVENYVLNWSDTYLKYGEWIAAPRNIKYFQGERIIIREIPDKTRLKVAYTNKEFTVKNTAHIFIPNSADYPAKYLCAILNSSLIGFYFRNKFSEKDDVFPKAKLGQCRLLPIKKPLDKYMFDVLIDKILKIKDKNPDAEITSIVKEIDFKVYSLYNLNEEEIRIIEEELFD